MSLTLQAPWAYGAIARPEPTPLPAAVTAALLCYQHIQRSLAEDSLAGVSQQGLALAAAAREGAGGGLPVAVAEAADRLATARGLPEARRAFRSLSAGIIAWLDAHEVRGTGLQEAYCPMADASWLQREPEIANPYHGRGMLRCGVIERVF
jgi:Cu(I)/Ag(I) efflux system membrane fusion protein